MDERILNELWNIKMELVRIGDAQLLFANEQSVQFMAQLHTFADYMQCFGGALLGALAALAVIGGLKL